MRVTKCWDATHFSLGKKLLASTAQVKFGLVSVHRCSVFQGIKNVRTQCKNGTQNERSYGCYKRFPCLMRRLDFGQLIAGIGPPTWEYSASWQPLVLPIPQPNSSLGFALNGSEFTPSSESIRSLNILYAPAVICKF